MIPRACNRHDVASSAAGVSCMFHMNAYTHAWETKDLSALLREDSRNSQQANTYADLAARVHSMEMVVEALASVAGLVMEEDAASMDVGDDSAADDDDTAYYDDYFHVETTIDGVGVIQVPDPEAHDSAQRNDFENNVHDLNVYHMAREVADGMESGGVNTIRASRGMAVGPRPKSWEN